MICETCKKGCQPLACNSRPEASEWYCARCHKSYPMSAQEFAHWGPRSVKSSA